MNKNKIRTFAVIGIILTILIALIAYALTKSDFFLKTEGYRHKPKNSLGYVRVGRVEYKAKDIFFLGDFTANMATYDRSSKFVRVEVRLKMSDTDMANELKRKNIILRDAVIEEMSLKRFSEISTEKGKIRLKENIKKRLNNLVVDGEVEDVLFTKFLIQ